MLDYRLFKEINDLFSAGRADKGRRLLMEVQSRCIALRDEMSMLQIRLKTLEDVLHLAQNIYSKNGFYWLKTSGIDQGPFCPRCYDNEGSLIRLERMGEKLHCPYCHAMFTPQWNDNLADGTGGRHARILPFAK